MSVLQWKGRRAYAVHYEKVNGKDVRKWVPLGLQQRKIDGQEKYLQHVKANSGHGDREAKFEVLEPHFWKFYSTNHSEITCKHAANHWKSVKDEFLGSWIHHIDARRVEDFKASKKWAVATWKIRLVLLKQFIAYAQAHGFKTSNPFATIKIKQKKISAYMPKFRPWEDVLKLLEYMKKHCQEHNYLAALLMAYTGMRPIELTRLKKEHFELGRIIAQGKDKVRKVPSHPNITKHLGKLPIIFNQDAFHSALQRVCRKLFKEYNYFTPYTFRHSFATEYLRKTKNLKGLKQILGHDNIQMTARYAWVLDDEQKQGVEMLD